MDDLYRRRKEKIREAEKEIMDTARKANRDLRDSLEKIEMLLEEIKNISPPGENPAAGIVHGVPERMECEILAPLEKMLSMKKRAIREKVEE